jgi:phosphatidylinositol-3-phosphatase
VVRIIAPGGAVLQLALLLRPVRWSDEYPMADSTVWKSSIAPAGDWRRQSGAFVLVLLISALIIAGCSSPASKATTTSSSSTTTAAPTSTSTTPPKPKPFVLSDIHHVFVIVLENESSDSTFGTPTNDPYLASTMVSKGALLSNFYAIGHHSDDNYIAMISGQPPTTDTQGDCQEYVNISGTLGPGGIETGDGCIYPPDVPTLASQLTAHGFTWKAYMQDMGNIPSRELAACGHPPVNAPDNTELAVPGDGYATRHDPFMYFHSIIDNAQYCDSHVVALGDPDGQMPASALRGETGLATDLRSVSTTPNYSFITPNLCEDGHDYPCINQPSGSSAFADFDSFLETWVPLITDSPAFKENGMLIVTFDEAETGPQVDAACCGEAPGPAASEPGENGPGGGLIGAVVLSPFIRPGTVSRVAYNDFSFLATVEDIFGLAKLGEARTTTTTFGAGVFEATTPG